MKRPTKLQLASWILAGLVALGAIGVYAWRAMAPTDPQTEKARRLWGELREPNAIEWFLIEIGIKSQPRGEREVMRELGALGPPAVPYLIRALDHANGYVRHLAAQGLGRLGQEAEAAAPKLLDIMKHDYVHIRPAAAEALARIGRGDEAVPLLAKMLRRSDEFDRSAAARALGNLGPLGEPVIPDLIRALTDPERRVRDKASGALARIGPPAVPALIKTLEHPDATVRKHAAWALGQIGPGAAAATTALERAMKDENALVRSAAAKALKRIQGEGR